MFKQLVLASAVALSVLPLEANAQIKVGVTISTTGPAASLGIPEKMAFAIMPKEIDGQKVDYIVLDDASDPVAAVKNTRKFVSEDKVDVIAGSSTTPSSLAMIDVAADSQTPMISIASSIKIVDPVDAKRFWVFKTPQTDAIMLTAVTAHMADHGVKTVGLIGFNDAYGEGVMREFNTLSGLHHLKVVAQEQYKRNDTSVIGQALKIMEAHPDAVLIAASGTPGALPATTLRDRGYKGKIYFTDGIINQDFLRVGGKAVEGAFLPAGPFVVAKQLPDSNPIKKVSLDFTKRYDAAYPHDPANSFSAHAWNVYLLLKNAIPVALKTAKPGTKEFRSALRDALENTTDLVTTHGIMNMSKTDHMGFDQRSRVMVEIVNGQWKLVK